MASVAGGATYSGGGMVGRRGARFGRGRTAADMTPEEIEARIAEIERVGVVGTKDPVTGKRVITQEDLERAYGEKGLARYGVVPEAERAGIEAQREAHRQKLAAAAEDKAVTYGAPEAAGTKEFGPVPATEAGAAPEFAGTEEPAVGAEAPRDQTARPRRVREMRMEMARKRMAREMVPPTAGYSIGTEGASPFLAGTSAPLTQWGMIDEEDGYLMDEYNPNRRRNPWEV